MKYKDIVELMEEDGQQYEELDLEINHYLCTDVQEIPDSLSGFDGTAD